MARRDFRQNFPRVLFYDLPNEIVLELAKYLRPQELNSLIRTCRRYAELLQGQLAPLAVSHIREDGRSVLMWALDHGNKVWALKLLESGADISVCDNKGETVFYSALRLPSPDYALVERLLVKRTPLARHLASEPLWIAVVQGDLKMAQLLLGARHLHGLCSRGWKETMETLVDQQNIAMYRLLDASGLLGCYPFGLDLERAAEYGRSDMVQFLINTYGRRNGVEYYQRALCLAATGGHAEVAQQLILSMHSLRFPIPGVALNEAATLGHERLVELLLSGGAATDVQSHGGYGTALHAAALLGHERIVPLLLNAGANASLQSKKPRFVYTFLRFPSPQAKEALQTPEHIALRQGSTPLHMAASMGHVQAARLLVEAGADVTLQNILGDTPSHAAAEGGNLAIMQLLIDAGGDISFKNDMSDTVLHVATARGHTDMFQLLLAFGADLACKNDVGDSLLHTAAEGGYEDIVRLLVQLGADLSDKNNRGESAFQKAANMGHQHIARLLKCTDPDPPVRDHKDHLALSWQVIDGMIKYPSPVSFS